MLARVAADLRDVVADGVDVDPAAALDQLLLDGSPLRRDEHLALALGAHHGQRHLHVRLLHALFGPQAEIDLLRKRDGKGIALDRGPVLAGLGLEWCERGLVVPGSSAGECGCA